MTPQELVDHIVPLIIAQGRPSLDGLGRPVYRGKYECRCPVGMVIPDDQYRPEYEHINCVFLTCLQQRHPEASLKILACLQAYHDVAALNCKGRDKERNPEFLSHFMSQVRHMCAREHLKMPTVSGTIHKIP
jgi:hypothetical protein